MEEIKTYPGITYLYVIYSTSGYYKIGISRHPGRRLKNIDRGTLTPFCNSFLCLIPFSDNIAKIMERMMHQKFASRRVNGEWFDLGPFDIAFLAKLEVEVGEYWLKRIVYDNAPLPFTAENGDCSFLENGDLR